MNKIRNILSQKDGEKLVQAFVNSRLDFLSLPLYPTSGGRWPSLSDILQLFSVTKGGTRYFMNLPSSNHDNNKGPLDVARINLK